MEIYHGLFSVCLPRCLYSILKQVITIFFKNLTTQHNHVLILLQINLCKCNRVVKYILDSRKFLFFETEFNNAE
jgi:hypothetical protein